ncbi:MAG: ATP-binding cassette domain-containing protein [Candidatus ainarchaeum sp.]|nr:ATP-binding cassette domain-containing protein [Candidatus ainarchaeum sp.]
MPEEKTAVKLEEISKQFGSTKALDGISFEVKTGHVFGLLGPNGAGKTTAIRIMLNLIEKYDGKVEIFEKKFSEKTKNLFGYLPEERGLYKNEKAIDAAAYLGALKGISEKESAKEAARLMKELNLLEYKNKKIFELSKGTQQKMQIISSIIHNPLLLVWDEPFSGLDPLSVKFVIETIKKQKENGKTIILSTHNMGIAEEICDKVIVINKGRRVLYGTVKEIKERYSENSAIIELSEEDSKFENKAKKISGIKKIKQKGKKEFELAFDMELKPEELLKELVKNGFAIIKFEETSPSLESIFLSVVEAEQWMKN